MTGRCENCGSTADLNNDLLCADCARPTAAQRARPELDRLLDEARRNRAMRGDR